MRLEFSEKSITKKYEVKFKERVTAPNYEVEENEFSVDISVRYHRDSAVLVILSTLEEGDGVLEKILEIGNTIFDRVEYSLTEKGEPDTILNLEEIIEKWNSLRKEKFFNMKTENEKEFIFKLSRMINSKGRFSEMLKRFNVVPYLFAGLYNQEIKKASPLRLKRKLYNVFPLMNIPIQYEVYDTSQKGSEITYTIKEDELFDRSEYTKQVLSCYPTEAEHKIGSFDLKGGGKYLFDEDNIVTMMTMDILIEIRNLVNYQCEYILKEQV